MRAVTLLALLVAGCNDDGLTVSWMFERVASDEIVGCPRGAAYADVHIQHVLDDGMQSLSGFPRWFPAAPERVDRFPCDDLEGAISALDDDADNPTELPSAFDVFVEIKTADESELIRSRTDMIGAQQMHFDLLLDGGYFQLPSSGYYSLACVGAATLWIGAESADGVVYAENLRCEGLLPEHLYTPALAAGTYSVWMETFDPEGNNRNDLETWSDQELRANNDVRRP